LLCFSRFKEQQFSTYRSHKRSKVTSQIFERCRDGRFRFAWALLAIAGTSFTASIAYPARKIRSPELRIGFPLAKAQASTAQSQHKSGPARGMVRSVCTSLSPGTDDGSS
jgi:hypothetical protein